MKRKQVLVTVAVAAVVAVVSFVLGWASGPDSAARIVPRTAEEWSAAAAWATFFAAVAAAWFALRQVTQAREASIAQAQPHVVAYLEQDPDIPWAVDIVIGNFGPTAARDVTVTTDVPVRTTGESGSGPETVALPKRFSTLAPGQRWRTMWDWSPSRRDDPALTLEDQVTFTYTGVESRKRLVERSELDWTMVSSRTFADKKTIHHAAKELLEVRKILDRQERAQRQRARRQAPQPGPGRAPFAPKPTGGFVTQMYRRLTGR